MKKAPTLLIVLGTLMLLVAFTIPMQSGGTTLFVDGFEDGLTPWDGSSGSPIVSTDFAFSGNYSLKASSTMTYAFKRFSKEDIVRASFYVRLEALPITEYRSTYFLKLQGNAGARIGSVGVYFDGTQTNFIMAANLISSTNIYASNIQTGTWYSMSILFVSDATNGEYRGFLNDEEVVTLTGLDTSSTGAKEVLVGITYSEDSLPVYIDDVLITCARGTLAVDAVFDSTSVDATVVVDGTSYTTPFTINLDEGTYDLSASYNGQTQTQFIEIIAEQTTQYTFQFASQEPPLTPPTSPIIAPPTTTIESKSTILKLAGVTFIAVGVIWNYREKKSRT